MGKGRAIQRLGGGDIPAPSEWSSLPGQVVVTGTYTGTIKRRRESVNSVDLTLKKIPEKVCRALKQSARGMA